MQIVDPGPRQLATPHPVHCGGIAGPPFVGEDRPIPLQPVAFTECFQLTDDAGPPVDDGAEHIEGQGFHC
jgi:hypothetical protein